MIDPAFLAEIRRRTSLAELVGGLVALKPSGRELRGLCPFHKERTPSFYVVEAKGFWHCFGCGAHGDAFGWVRRTLLAKDFPEAVEYLAGRAGLRPDGPSLDRRPIVQRPAEELRDAERQRKVKGARAIWAETTAPQWTPVDKYLSKQRGIRLPIPPTIRYAERLEHPFLRKSHYFPAMVGAVQAPDRRIVGVHLTYLAPDGSKMPAPPGWPAGEEWKGKIMRGSCREGALRLTAAEDVMILAEGIETALSVLQALHDAEIGAPHIDGEPVGVWAALSLGNMGLVGLPASVREVILAADNDGKIPDAAEVDRVDPEAAILAAAAHHRDQGRNVRIARPPAVGDFNDMLPAGAGFRSEEAVA